VCATLFENKRGGLSYRRREQQQPSNGQNECGIATTNAGWTRGGWGDQQHGHGVRCTDFLLQEGSSREETGKWLKKNLFAIEAAPKHCQRVSKVHSKKLAKSRLRFLSRSFYRSIVLLLFLQKQNLGEESTEPKYLFVLSILASRAVPFLRHAREGLYKTSCEFVKYKSRLPFCNRQI
jgi:hypothetical protein